MGGVFVSTDIIQFIQRPQRDHEQTDFPTIAFRTAVRESRTNPTDIVLPEYVATDGNEMW